MVLPRKAGTTRIHYARRRGFLRHRLPHAGHAGAMGVSVLRAGVQRGTTRMMSMVMGNSAVRFVFAAGSARQRTMIVQCRQLRDEAKRGIDTKERGADNGFHPP